MSKLVTRGISGKKLTRVLVYTNFYTEKGGYFARLGSRLLGVVDVSIKCFYCHLLHSILNTYIIPYPPSKKHEHF